MDPEYVEYIIKKYDLDYIVHGDDPCLTPDGKDVYEAAKERDKYRSIPRTEGVSTTDIVGRMLLNTKAHHHSNKRSNNNNGNNDSNEDTMNTGGIGIKDGTVGSTSTLSSPDKNYNGVNDFVDSPTGRIRTGSISQNQLQNLNTVDDSNSNSNSNSKDGGHLSDIDDIDIDDNMSVLSIANDHDNSLQAVIKQSRRSNFLTTSHILRCFSRGVQPPLPTSKVIYIAGDWDMFHAGHVLALEKAKELGNYLIVGVHSDAIVNARYGYNLPIMNLQERVLSVLGCKNVDDVLIDAPYSISADMVSSLNIAYVVKSEVDNLDYAIERKYSSSDLNGIGPNNDSSSLTTETVTNTNTNTNTNSTTTITQDGASIHTDADGIQYIEGSDDDPYTYVRKMGILKEIQTPSKFKKLTVLDIVDRIKDQRVRFEAKFRKKKAAEDEYYENRYNKKK
jgi:cytidyltransferase-like protein